MLKATQVYALKLTTELPEVVYQKLLRFVAAEKREKIHKFHKRDDSLRCLMADLLIRYILNTLFELSNQNISFDYTHYGKPLLHKQPHIHFNSSHSGHWAVCAVDKNPIGIDVEKIQPIDLDIAEQYFSKQESQQLFSLPHNRQLDFFYELWTLKESFLKYKGKGLSIPLNSFTINQNNNGNISITTEKGAIKNTYFKQYNLEKNYKMTLCTTNQFINELILIEHDELVTYLSQKF